MRNLMRWISFPMLNVDSIEAVRAALLCTVERLFALAMIPLFIVACQRIYTLGWHPVMTVYFLMIGSFVLLAAFGPRILSYTTRSVMMISSVMLGGLGGLWGYGLLGNGWVLSAIVAPALTSIFWSGRWSLLVCLVALVAGSLIAWMWNSGMLTHIIDPLAFLASPSSWITMMLLVVAFSLVFQIALWQMHRHLEHALRRQQGDKTTLLRETGEQMHYLRSHDPLTGLLNLPALREHFTQALALAEYDNTKIGLMVLDLDRFKAINDALGHAIGDRLLRALTERLRDCVRDTDVICRQGGDEFVLFLPVSKDSMVLSHVAGKILGCLQPVFSIDEHEIACSVSIGIAVYRDDGEDFDTLHKKADTAMYEAKATGRNTYRFFDKRMNVDAIEHLQLTSDLRYALERGQLQLHFQPQIEVASGEVVGAEALLRWNHPQRGLVPPALFIPLAERGGLIEAIGDWVLEEACRHASGWQRNGFALTVAVNLSALQFRRGGIEETVMRALLLSGLPPALLELELTESVMIQNADEVMLAVERLHKIGIQISIDDFGTGYSCLSYLKRLRVDKLKIDQSFILSMLSDRQDAAIVHTVIEMARSLELKTVAEGVEDELVIAELRGLRCDIAQGYWIARPMPDDAFIRWLNLRKLAAQNTDRALHLVKR